MKTTDPTNRASATTKTYSDRLLGLIILTLLLDLSSAAASVTTKPAAHVLTTAAEIRNMPPAEAEQHYPVKLRGVVTFYDDALFSRFVQDETAGIYLDGITNPLPLRAGQVVEVEGVTGSGEFAPVVVTTEVKVVGEGNLPVAKSASLEQVLSGSQDSQMVEVNGTVRSVYFDKESQIYQVEIMVDGQRLTVYSRQLPVAKPDALVASTVKVRGVCSTMFNQHRQLFGFRLLVCNADGLTIEKPAAPDPFDIPTESLNALMQFRPHSPLGNRIKVTGPVVYYQAGNAIFIQDGDQGLCCKTRQQEPLQIGEHVEILGWPANGEYTPILEDAIYRKIGDGTEPKALEVDLNKLLTGAYDSRLVQIRATLLDRVDHGVNQFLLLKKDNFVFQALLPLRAADDWPTELANGTEVLVTGVCMIERGDTWEAGNKWRAKTFRLLVRNPKDVLVE